MLVRSAIGLVVVLCFAAQPTFADTIRITSGQLSESISTTADFAFQAEGFTLSGEAGGPGNLQACIPCTPGTPFAGSPIVDEHDPRHAAADQRACTKTVHAIGPTKVHLRERRQKVLRVAPSLVLRYHVGLELSRNPHRSGPIPRSFSIVGAWLSGRASPSHGGGQWFESTSAHYPNALASFPTPSVSVGEGRDVPALSRSRARQETADSEEVATHRRGRSTTPHRIRLDQRRCVATSRTSIRSG